MGGVAQVHSVLREPAALSFIVGFHRRPAYTNMSCNTCMPKSDNGCFSLAVKS